MAGSYSVFHGMGLIEYDNAIEIATEPGLHLFETILVPFPSMREQRVGCEKHAVFIRNLFFSFNRLVMDQFHWYSDAFQISFGIGSQLVCNGNPNRSFSSLPQVVVDDPGHFPTLPDTCSIPYPVTSRSSIDHFLLVSLPCVGDSFQLNITQSAFFNYFRG